MPRPKKNLETIANQFYLNTKDISLLLGCNWRNAKRLYVEADKIDNEELPFRLEPQKVRMQTVLKLAGIKKNQLDSVVERKQQKMESTS